MPSSTRGGRSGPAAGRTGTTPGRRPRPTVALIVGPCLVLAALLMAPGAGAETGGAISGAVTSASTHAPLGGIRVCAESTVVEVAPPPHEEGEGAETESEAPSGSGCATTDGSGQYTISGLSSGSFYVEFGGSSASEDYVTQFYNGKLAAAEAEQVPVTGPGTTSGINAEMQLGAEISGTVTEAASGAPLAHIAVCAQARTGPRAGEGAPCALTNSSGAYTIYGLPSASYTISFSELFGLGSGRRFELQYYNDKSSAAEATVLQLTAPNVTSGIDAALARATAHPGGGSPLGPPPLRSPSPGSGTPATPGAQSPLASGFAVVLHSTKIEVRSGVALVRLECHTACHGTLALQATHAVKHDGRKLKRPVSIGSAGFTLVAQRAAVVKVKLNATGRALLRSAHGHIACRLTITQLKPAPTREKKLTARLLVQAPHPKTRH